MNRSIPVLIFILFCVIIATAVIIRRPIPKQEKEITNIATKSKLSLKQYRYNRDIQFASEEKAPDYSIDDFLERGYELLNKGEYKKAEDIFKTALLFNPDNAETLRSIGEIVFQGERYNEACNYFVQYLDHRPDAIESYTNLAIAYLSVEKFAKAELTLNQGLNRLGEDSSGAFYFIYACLKMKQGATKQAESYLFKAHEMLGDDILKLVNTKWSKPISELAAYKKIQSIIDDNE